MRIGLILLLVGVSLFARLDSAAKGAMLNDDFSAGIQPSRWQVSEQDAAGFPWTIQCPDSNGALRFSKPQDTAPWVSGLSPNVRLDSTFQLIGDFSAFVDFHILNLPLADAPGVNDILFSVGGVEVGRTNDQNSQRDEAYSSFFDNVVPDATTIGRLGVTRSGQTVSAYVDRGSGPVLIGSATSSSLTGPTSVTIWAIQQENQPLSQRPHTPIDVEFDNVAISANTITPEPSSIAPVLIAGVGLLRGRRSRRRPTSAR